MSPTAQRPRRPTGVCLFKTTAAWESIQVEFFQLQQSPASHPLADLLETAAVRHTEDLDASLDRLPTAMRSRVRTELLSPQFLVKLSEFYAATEIDAGEELLFAVIEKIKARLVMAVNSLPD